MQEFIPHPAKADSRPLPLIVAEKWGFSLAHVYEEDSYWYAILDWIVGLIQCTSIHASKTWNDMQAVEHIYTSVTNRTILYIRKDGRAYPTAFTNDKGLYIIAQELRSNKNRPLLKEIKIYLSKAGAFADLVRRNPETLIEAVADNDPDKALDAVIKMYQREGKSDEWIFMRINTKIQRAAFTSALKAAIADTAQTHYSTATNQIYLGLWERTAKRLKEELALPKHANLRDHQPIAALYYQGLAEDGCARELGDKQELTWHEAMLIIQDIAHFIGEQARAYGQRFGVDLATGKSLLRDKN